MRRANLLALLPLTFIACAPSGSEHESQVESQVVLEGSPEALAILALVNDPAIGLTELDDDARLDARAATNIIAHRDGQDGTPGTDDDDLFDSIAELDGVSYVGERALLRLLDHATALGYFDTTPLADVDVVFSPKPYAQSHNVRIANLIDGADETIDIAMYSWSDQGIFTALENAVDRGVTVRFVFETANEDRKLSGSDMLSSKSGRLESIGVDVRWVNKIMHHKFILVDGPRDDIDKAETARFASGSGNWSYGAATQYDENTIFASGSPELALRLQAEFNHLWDHSRSFEAYTLPYITAGLDLSSLDLERSDDVGAHFTSDNFSVSSGGDTFRIVTGSNEVSDALVNAILDADESIWIASGHLRSRAVAEALMSKKEADEDFDIKVYLDGQEYISEWYHQQQVTELEACLQSASTPSQERNCTDRGFYFGYQVAQAGIDVRYKYYAYRWHYSYAPQMHHKYVIIDGDELWTGSYNLSDNAEHNTFENTMMFRGAAHSQLVSAYVDNFNQIFETNRAGTAYDDLLDTIETAVIIPLVFDPIALTWEQVRDLKTAIYANCALINTDAYRQTPESHQTCPRS